MEAWGDFRSKLSEAFDRRSELGARDRARDSLLNTVEFSMFADGPTRMSMVRDDLDRDSVGIISGRVVSTNNPENDKMLLFRHFLGHLCSPCFKTESCDSTH